MILTIDNLDGQGARDYSAALCPKEVAAGVKALTIERTLNAPSRVSGTLLFGGEPGEASLPVPVRRARVVLVSALSGTALFTGYLATEPVAIYSGAGIAGAVYRYEFSALSDEWLLDKQTAVLTNSGYSMPAGTVIQEIVSRTAAGVLTTTGVAPGQAIGVFTPEQGKPFSSMAGEIANSTLDSYRTIAGGLSLNPVGATTHSIDFDTGTGGGTLTPAALRTAQARELANDVTLTGEIEPGAYATELFEGDGTTTLFLLSEVPHHVTKPTLLTDNFAQASFNTLLWQVTDPGSHLTLGAGGLVLTGGNGYDGQTTLAAWDSFELGGSLVLEAADVQLNAPSDGVLLGLYSGLVQRANCVAGYNVRQSGGNTVLTPYVNGAEVGTTFTVVSGHSYTLRIRLHSPEFQRVLQTYYARVDGVTTAFGGGLVASPAAVVFDLVDLGNAANTPATVLYDGAIASTSAKQRERHNVEGPTLLPRAVPRSAAPRRKLI